MNWRQLIGRALVMVGVGFAGLAGRSAGAADYEIVASGPFVTSLSDSGTFDGTTPGTLPPLLDAARLQGGSFRATYRFTPVTPDAGTDTIYELSPSSGFVSYELLDAGGAVVYRGTNSSEPLAFLENNVGGAPFTVDQVLLTSTVNNVTGVTFPAPLYSPAPVITSVADFNVNGYVSDTVNYLNDLSIPTDAATYLAFPTANAGRAFDVLIEFSDGDYMNRVGPYQDVFSQLQYDIAALTVTPVPEPAAAACLLGAGAIGLLRRRR